ncbi:MAG: Sapep family Mn(2+)-dependent dipeptidase [Armatimonadetes bacterium]|nr:Sapep family Mn(2+)-dependent dipeptidase [Armatimonadota bacterium]
MADVSALDTWIEAHVDDLVAAVQSSVRVPSVKGEPDGPGSPYGREVRAALDDALDLCRSLGFAVSDIDGHAAHAEFGQGAEMVAALGHLDVVPAGDRWTRDPFGGELVDGFIYGRGTSDDKGPTIAALFGAKALMESGLPLQRRVRVIFGCDEESGFSCVKHYWDVAGQERPAAAFAPDAGFPLVYAEKGICDLALTLQRPAGCGGLRVVAATGGRRSNMVPDAAEARIGGPADALAAAAGQLAGYWDRNVTYAAEGDELVVRSIGKSAHGSLPQEGDNAIVRLARALRTLPLGADVAWAGRLVETGDPAGSGLGIEGRDEVVGPLTCNMGILEVTDDCVRVVYNVRYPVLWEFATLIHRVEAGLAGGQWVLAQTRNGPALYAPLDAEPARTLMAVYREVTGDTVTKPLTMGGGTYARATPNAVAYGADLPGSQDGPAHEPDERIAVSTLVTAAKIYARALHALANVSL